MGSGAELRYVWDGAHIIAEYTGGSLTKKYIYGPGMDNPVAMINVSGTTETWYYYYTDALGSVRMMTDAGGNVAESYTYDVYGKPYVMTSGGTDGNWLTEDVSTFSQSATGYAQSAIGNPYLFTARRWDSATSQYYYRFRDYSPELGRFLQPDPAGYIDTLNLYAYCGNNPLNWTDPWGLETYNPWGSNTYIGPYYAFSYTPEPIIRSPELEAAYDYLIANYPDLFKGDPIVADADMPLCAGFSLCNCAWVDTNEIAQEFPGEQQSYVVAFLSHELMHLQDGFWKTLFGELSGRHDEIYEEAEKIRMEYLKHQKEEKSKKES